MIIEHIEGSCLLPAYQSAYRQFHGVETAMVKMYHDLLETIDKGIVTIVVMIDLSAAFDTIDIQMAIEILKNDFGIQGIPLNWIESYLTERSSKIVIGNSTSQSKFLNYGVPLGSCAGPVIFTMNIAALNKVVNKYPSDLYGYADDHKLVFRILAGNQQNEELVLQQLNICLKDVINWMTTFKLKMNNSKTDIIMYGTSQQLAKVNISSIDVGGCQLKCVDQVRDIGVLMSSTLHFDSHIRKNAKFLIYSSEI